jgi:hypothetical protein
MSIEVSYQKAQVLEALRYHFIKQPEIKTLMIVVNVYAILTGTLLFLKKIRPELFLLGSVLWIVLLLLFWFLMPNIFYKKTALFSYDWNFSFDNQKASLQSLQGEAAWSWEEVSHYFESPHFFHIYFGPKTFFLIPNDNMTIEVKQTLRAILKKK